MDKARIALRKHVAEGYRGLLAAETFLNGEGSGVPRGTLDLVRLRVSQINGCAFCVDMHAREAREAGETERRLYAVAAWRETSFFTGAERAALALAEATTRVADSPEGVPQGVWDAAAAHYDEAALSSLVLAIAVINAWNRLNVAVRTPVPAS
ncbi:carboxymuconolactone decarboxylase family protein [Streptomyces specialis]|uniref:carboxymuconolactone decarboxylase family protein n=1 Tax=Streptomyces specialis TaxID=498367 RepID=UPI00073E56B8|nr:carboxymuconolactone decarboxylase family protein [Streptomyces specialis]